MYSLRFFFPIADKKKVENFDDFWYLLLFLIKIVVVYKKLFLSFIERSQKQQVESVEKKFQQTRRIFS